MYLKLYSKKKFLNFKKLIKFFCIQLAGKNKLLQYNLLVLQCGKKKTNTFTLSKFFYDRYFIKTKSR